MSDIILYYTWLCITPYCLWIFGGMVKDFLAKDGIPYEQE